MNKGICLQTVLFGLTILGIFMILKNNKEGFSDLGIYPESVIKGLLYPSYKMKNNPGLSNLDMQKPISYIQLMPWVLMHKLQITKDTGILHAMD